MKHPFTFGLRGRLILILLAALAALIVLIVAQTLDHRDDKLRDATIHIQHSAQLFAARQQSIVAQADAILTGLMLDSALQPGAPAEACAQTLAKHLAHEKKFIQIGKVLPDGEIVCLAVPATNHINIADRNYFKAALQSNDLVISDVITSRSLGNPVVTFAKAMRNSAGQVSGLLFLSIDLTWLHQELATAHLPEGARLVVVDPKGTVAIHHPDPERLTGSNIANQPLFLRITTGGEGTLESIGLDGIRKIFGFTPLLETVAGHMTLWLSVPKAVIEAPVRRELGITLGIAFVVLVATLGLVAWGGSRLVVRPLLKLSRMAQRISAGDLTARSGLPHGDDEIGRLARTLDETAESIVDREHKLVRANRALRVLSGSNRTLSHATDEESLLREMCRAVVEAGDYRLAWVGYARADKRVEVVASWGATVGLLAELDMTWDETETGRGPTGTAIRRGIPVVSSNVETDPDYAHWRDLAQRHGIGSALALPLRLDGNVIGALCICAAETDAFDADVTKLLSESADKLAQGIATQRTQANLKLLEQRNTLILHATGDGIYGVDREGDATFINPAGAAMLQRPMEEIVGQSTHVLFHHSRADLTPYPREECPVYATYRDGISRRIADDVFWRKDGTGFPVEYVSTPMRDMQGNLTGAVVSFRDISGIRQAEQELRKSEARFRNITETARDAIITLDAESGTVIEWNPAAEAIFGYAKQEMAGQLLHDFITPARLREAAKAGLVHFAASGEGAAVGKTLELPALHKNGTEFPIELSLSAMQIQGKWQATGIARDITGRKQAEIILQKSRDLLQSVVENVPARIFWKDSESRFLGCNTLFARDAGRASPDELAGRTDFDMSWKDQAEMYRADDKAVMESGNHRLNSEEPQTTPDGNTIWLRTSKVPMRDESNRVVGLLGIYDDITERKVAEEQLRKLSLAVEQSSESIVITNLDAEIEYVNEAFVQVTGYGREEAIGQNPRILHSGKTKPETYADMWDKLTHGRSWKGEFINRRKDGSEYVEFAIITPLRQPDGTITHYVSVKEDVTEKKRLGLELDRHRKHLEELVSSRTEQLTEARKLADAANQAKSAFLAAMSHEIRTPMNGVIGMVDVLQQTSLQGYQVDMVDVIRESAFSLLGIIEDILDFSKIEAGKLEVEREPTALAEVVEKACGILDHLAVSKGVELTLFTDPAIPAQILGDAQRLHQIIVNLANNAIKFSSGLERNGHVSVRALLVEREAERAVVEIRVVDNGIGMDEATQARLFIPFTQAETSTTRRFGGTGLGLSIARQLAELMGGDIAVHSASGAGATFVVHLPCVALPEPAPTAGDAAPSPLAGLPCLMVGGVDGLADDLAVWLAAAGAQVERAPDLVAARASLALVPSGPMLCLIDAGNAPPAPDELRTLAAARPQGNVHVLVIVIGRGQRRRLRHRQEDSTMFELDGNVLTRPNFLAAVAVAAGLAVETVDLPEHGRSAASLIPPARVVALSEGRLVLVAEDNETNQKVIVQQLALLGFAADVAADGREALARWGSGDYALLLSDLHMPHMDGYELATAIRAAENEKPSGEHRTPIVALTANALKGEAQHCLDAGMDDYLSKPTPLADLKTMLEKWLPVAAESAPVEPVTDVGRASARHVGLKPDLQLPIQPVAVSVPVDVNVLKKLVGDDEEIIRDFLHSFHLSAAKIAAELRAACAAGQAADAGALVHKLKSSARSVGALALGELCAAMEQAGKAGDMAALAALLPGFEQELAAVEDFLEEYLL